MLKKLVMVTFALGYLACGAVIVLEATGLLFNVGTPDAEQRAEAFLAKLEAELDPTQLPSEPVPLPTTELAMAPAPEDRAEVPTRSDPEEARMPTEPAEPPEQVELPAEAGLEGDREGDWHLAATDPVPPQEPADATEPARPAEAADKVAAAFGRIEQGPVVDAPSPLPAETEPVRHAAENPVPAVTQPPALLAAHTVASSSPRPAQPTARSRSVRAGAPAGNGASGCPVIAWFQSYMDPRPGQRRVR